MTTQEQTPLPRIQHRKGFSWLPLPQQLSVFTLVGLLLLALLPALIDPGRAAGGQLKPAMVKPRSVSTALARIERHVGLRWWMDGSAGEQRLRQKLLLATLGITLAGAIAGRTAQEPAGATPSPSTPRIYGQAHPIRARSATSRLEDDHAA